MNTSEQQPYVSLFQENVSELEPVFTNESELITAARNNGEQNILLFGETVLLIDGTHYTLDKLKELLSTFTKAGSRVELQLFVANNKRSVFLPEDMRELSKWLLGEFGLCTIEVVDDATAQGKWHHITISPSE